VDDWDCRLISVGAAELRVYFSSAARSSNPTYNRDLYLIRSTDLGQNWGAPELSDAGDASQFDRYPAVVQSGPGAFHLAFHRQDTDNLLDPTSDIFVSESSDGLSWSAPTPVTADVPDSKADLFSSYFRSPLLDRWVLSWTRSTGGLAALPVGDSSPVDLTPVLGMGGWSPRTAPASGGLSLLVFVSAGSGTPQLYAVILPL
jgi:hypothetical protein